MERRTAEMTERLTKLGDESVAQADMHINMDKTYTQHVHRRAKIKITQEEARAVEEKYDHKCDFCIRRFKSRRGMLIHRAQCQHNYATTDKAFPLEDILDVFGHRHSRWFKVKWEGHDEPEWEREHLLVRDGCGDSIRDFWATSGKQPSKEFYEDKDGKHRCTI